MVKRKKNIIEDIYFMMRGVDTDALWPTIETLTDIHLADRDGRTLLVNAASCGRLDVVKYALDKGADINAADRFGFTALHFAVQEQDLEMVRFLLINGANANAKNTFGNNPLFILKANTQQAIFDLLITHGADPYSKNNYGVSAADTWQGSGYPDYILKHLDQ